MPLLLNELQDILQTGLNKKEDWSPVIRNTAPNQSRPSPSATYALEHVNELVEKLQTLGNDESEHKFKIRYLMPDENTLLLAREGKRSAEIPGHKDMCNHCVSAGNLYLSQDFETVIGISHDSGDFLPSMGSLVFPLRRLMETNLLDSTNNLALHYRIPLNPSVLTASFSRVSLHDMIAQLTIPEIQAVAPVDAYGTPPPRPKRSFESIYAQNEHVPAQNTGLALFSIFAEPVQPGVEQVDARAAAQNTL